jgi:hypothetical protein
MTIVPIRVLGGQVYLGTLSVADVDETIEPKGTAAPASRPAQTRKNKPAQRSGAQPQQ